MWMQVKEAIIKLKKPNKPPREIEKSLKMVKSMLQPAQTLVTLFKPTLI